MVRIFNLIQGLQGIITVGSWFKLAKLNHPINYYYNRYITH